MSAASPGSAVGAKGLDGNVGRLTTSLFEQQRGIGLCHAGSEAGHAGDRCCDLFDQQLLAQVAAQLRLGHAVLAQESFERGLVEAARYAGKGGDVGDAAVDQPLADAEAHFGRELVERQSLDQLVEHLVEPARFDKRRHRHPGLVLPRLIIGEADAIAQLADADFLAADLGDIGAAHAAKGRIAGDVAERKGHADKRDEAERKEFADGRGKHAADGGNHGAGNLSAGRGDARLRDALEARRHGIKARNGLFMAAQRRLRIVALPPLGLWHHSDSGRDAAMARRKYVVGNWKMNGVTASIADAQAIFAAAGDHAGVDVALCPPFTLIGAMVAAVPGAAVGGQDCHSASSGAFTGSVAAAMLADAGATLVIVGHSERREGCGEGDADVRAKAEAGLAAGLSVILCVGEPREVRESGGAIDYVLAQIAGSVPDDFDADAAGDCL